jgi:hypothetical protein
MPTTPIEAAVVALMLLSLVAPVAALVWVNRHKP